jgi:hypothetical protein
MSSITLFLPKLDFCLGEIVQGRIQVIAPREQKLRGVRLHLRGVEKSQVDYTSMPHSLHHHLHTLLRCILTVVAHHSWHSAPLFVYYPMAAHVTDHHHHGHGNNAHSTPTTRVVHHTAHQSNVCKLQHPFSPLTLGIATLLTR